MGLSDRMQAIAVFISGFFMALGTAGATLPGFIPDDFKVEFAVMFWLFGIIGFAFKEAVGGQAPAPAKANNP
jgi:hypothetical protein